MYSLSWALMSALGTPAHEYGTAVGTPSGGPMPPPAVSLHLCLALILTETPVGLLVPLRLLTGNYVGPYVVPS
jgi:hypothetical protein